MKQWREERCAELPEELQLISDNTYMQRKDIVEINHEDSDNMPAYKEYVCQSREITISEYEMLQSIEQIQINEAIDNYTVQLIEEGVLL